MFIIQSIQVLSQPWYIYIEIYLFIVRVYPIHRLQIAMIFAPRGINDVVYLQPMMSPHVTSL